MHAPTSPHSPRLRVAHSALASLALALALTLSAAPLHPAQAQPPTVSPAFLDTLENALHGPYDLLLEECRASTAAGLTDPHSPLTEEQRLAIFGYTARFSGQLNSALRRGTAETEHLTPYLETLNAGLDRLPDFTGWVRRGVTLPAPVLRDHQPGRVVTYTAYTSTSIDQEFPGQQRLLIRSKHGKLIEDYARFPEEHEVLFRPGSRFRVMERRDLRPKNYSKTGPEFEIVLQEE